MTKLFCVTCAKWIAGRRISTHKRHKHEISTSAPLVKAKAKIARRAKKTAHGFARQLLSTINKRSKDVLEVKKTEEAMRLRGPHLLHKRRRSRNTLEERTVGTMREVIGWSYVRLSALRASILKKRHVYDAAERNVRLLMACKRPTGSTPKAIASHRAAARSLKTTASTRSP